MPCRPNAYDAAQAPSAAPSEPDISGGSQVEKSQKLRELLKVVDQLNQDGPVFFSALQTWFEGDGASVPTELDDVFALKPRFELGEPTFDVLLYFYEQRKDAKDAWPSAPSSNGLLFPVFFQFFGFARPECVTSAPQLYKRAQKVPKELSKLADDEARCNYLHGLCFER